MAKKDIIITIKSSWCKGCRICVEICPKDVLEMSKEPAETGYFIAEVIHPEKCIACYECELHCPDLAITVTAKTKVTSKAKDGFQ